MTSSLKLSVAAAALLIGTTSNSGGVNAYSETASEIAKLQRKLNPSPGDILDTLDEYDKFWIEVVPHKTSGKGSCVWSECAQGVAGGDVDGEERDGDSEWYLDRTQTFCANAAFSLYGRKKYDANPLGWMGCSQRHYINSFFTYGGADHVLRAIGKTPEIYYGENGVEYNMTITTTTSTAAAVDDGAEAYEDAVANEEEDQQDYDDDDAYVTWSEEYPTNSNCVCMEEDGYGDYYWIDDEEQEDEDRRRLSGSHHSSDAQYTSTMGCDANGEYVMALFEGDGCDGNYFTQAIDNNMTTYNKQHESIGCHALYKVDDYDYINYSRVVELLKNSWTCDVTLYPDSCPDPYGKKKHYGYAMRQAQHGINPVWAMRVSEWRVPLHAASGIMFVITLLVLFVTYIVKNADRIKAGGGGWKVGFRCLCEDFKNLPKTFKAWRKSYMKALSERRARRLAKDDDEDTKKSWIKKVRLQSKSSSKKNADADVGEDKDDGQLDEDTKKSRWIKKIRLQSKKSSKKNADADADEDKDDGQLNTSTVDTLDENVEIDYGVIA